LAFVFQSARLDLAAPRAPQECPGQRTGGARDSLALLEQVAQEIQGGRDRPEMAQILSELRRAVSGPMLDLQNRWAAALEALNRADRDCQE
jgi:hypothetical protein